MVEFSHAIVFVSDMARSIAFYRDVLGLPLRFESPEWTEFDTPGSTLALHLADVLSPASSPQNSIPAGVCNLGFAVEDIDAFHQEMIAKGVPCLQPPEVEDFGGKAGRVCRSRWAAVLGKRQGEEVVMARMVFGRRLAPVKSRFLPRCFGNLVTNRIAGLVFTVPRRIMD